MVACIWYAARMVLDLRHPCRLLASSLRLAAPQQSAVEGLGPAMPPTGAVDGEKRRLARHMLSQRSCSPLEEGL